MAVGTALLKQYRNLAINIDSFSGGQAKLTETSSLTEEDDLTKINVTLSPTTGPYRGGSFVFKIIFGKDFPVEAPEIYSQTPIYHPNIDETGEVCLNLFDELWTSSNTMEDVIQGLLFLLYNPNLEDPLNDLFSGAETTEEFEKNIRRSLRGEEVDGTEFEENLMDGYESEENDDVVISKVKCCIEEEEDDDDGDDTSCDNLSYSDLVSEFCSEDIYTSDTNKTLRLKISSVDPPEIDERRQNLNNRGNNSNSYISLSRTKRAADLFGRLSTFVYSKFNNWFSTAEDQFNLQ